MPHKKKQIITLKNVTKKFGDLLVVDNVNLAINQGEMLAIIGPNGSGKSTLVQMILGLIRITEGTIELKTLNGIHDIGYVPQRFSVDRSIPITVKEFLDLQGCKIADHTHDLTAEEALKKVGMQNILNQKLGTLSGGQLQRVLIARALLHEKKVLVLDEPNTHIDVEGEKAIYELLKKLNEKDKVTVIVVSHELDFVTKYAKRVLCMNCSLICEGDPKKPLIKKAINHLYACKSC